MTAHPFIAYDVETKPRPDLVERFVRPLPAFDEEACRLEYSTARDATKGPAFIASKRADHEQKQAAHWRQAQEKAALNPWTAEVLVVGLIDQDAKVEYLEGTEREVLIAFWERTLAPEGHGRRWVNYTGNGDGQKNFDLDFLITRSRILGVHVPANVRQGRFYGSRFVNLAAEWLGYDRMAFCGLSRCADLLGLYEEFPAHDIHGIWPKRDDDRVTGESFHRYYLGTVDADNDRGEKLTREECRTLALHYLGNDLFHCFHIANRIL